jgi:hypothetical protein
MNVAQESETAAQKLRRAKALETRGLFHDAEQVYSELVDDSPENLQLRVRWIRAILRGGRTQKNSASRRKELLEQLQHPVFSEAGESGPINRLRILHDMGEMLLARTSLPSCIGALETISGCEKCFAVIPSVVEGGDQSALLIAVLQRMRQIAAKTSPIKEQGAVTLELGLLLALERFAEFVSRYDDLSDEIPEGSDRKVLAAVRRRLGLPRQEVFQEQKVFGVGVANTGTTSLSQALGLLGIDNGHWTNPLTRKLLSEIDFFMLGGATDGPVSHNFEQLYYQYPNAKFILTERPIDDWSRSMNDRYTDLRGSRERAIGWPSIWPYGARSEWIQFGLYLHHDRFEDAYLAHRERFESFVSGKPADRFLVLNIFEGHGWPELCSFLGRPLPDATFPWQNQRSPRD